LVAGRPDRGRYLQLFFWSDSKIYKEKSEDDRKTLGKEMYDNYFSKQSPMRVELPEELVKDVEESVNNGEYPQNLFEKSADQTYKYLKETSFHRFVDNCVLSAIYSKRQGATGVLPREFFSEAVGEETKGNWILARKAQDITVHFKTYEGYDGLGWKETTILRGYDTKGAFAFLRAHPFLIMPNTEGFQIVESIGETAQVCSFTAKPLPLAKRRRLLYFRDFHTLEDGTIVQVVRSVHHSKIPEEKNIIRAEFYFSLYMVSDVPEGAKFVLIGHTNFNGKLKNLSDFLRKVFAKRYAAKNMRLKIAAQEYLEKQEK